MRTTAPAAVALGACLLSAALSVTAAAAAHGPRLQLVLRQGRAQQLEVLADASFAEEVLELARQDSHGEDDDGRSGDVQDVDGAIGSLGDQDLESNDVQDSDSAIGSLGDQDLENNASAIEAWASNLSFAVQPWDGNLSIIDQVLSWEGNVSTAGIPASALPAPGVPWELGISDPVKIKRLMNRTKSLIVDLTGVNANSDDDTSALVSSLFLSGSTSGMVVLLFCLLRRWFPAVYMREAPEEAEASKPITSMFDWISMVLSTTPNQEVAEAGLDGWALLELHRLIIRILLTVGPAVVLIAYPGHFYAEGGAEAGDLLGRLDITHLPAGTYFLWLHAGLVWFVVAAVSWHSIYAQREFCDRRFEWLKTLPLPRATTIMVEQIPERYRSDRALKDYFNKMLAAFGPDVVERAYVVRKTHALQSKVAELADISKALDLQRSLKKPETRPELDRLMARHRKVRQELLHEVDGELAAQEEQEASDGQPNLEVFSGSGFVTFKSQVAQRWALKERFTCDASEFVIEQPPDPSDVIYADLAQDDVGYIASSTLGWLSLLLLFLLWSPIVLFISSLTTLESLQEVAPWVKDLCEQNPSLKPLLSGALATAALQLFMAFLPSVFLAIIEKFFTLRSGTCAQFLLEQWYFSFLMIFVLLVTLVGRSLLVTLSAIMNEPTKVIFLLAESLPGASHFYLNYMVIAWFSLSLNLLRYMNLFTYLFYRVAYSCSPELAKYYSEPEDQASYGSGSRIAVTVLMAAIALVLCSCSPAVVPFALVFFVFGRFIYGYLLIFVETKKPDLGGLLWVEALRQLFASLSIYVLLMTGVLAAKSEEHRWGPSMVALLSLTLVVWAHRRLEKFTWDVLPLEDLLDHVHADEPKLVIGRYVQCECDPETLKALEADLDAPLSARLSARRNPLSAR